MRNDLNASERRLIAALDRIDRFLDRTALARAEHAQTVADPEAGARLDALEAENRRLSQELAALHEREAATLDACEARLAEAHARLLRSGQEAARLSAANDALAEANRNLIDAREGEGDPDGIRAAMAAEIESLHAARAAEVAQMGEIVEALERMVGAPDPAAPALQPAAAGDGDDLDGERG
ncbi:hypothetical protein SAMN05421641_102194 [Paracoccus thiocyanatus]|uniref:Uncharacterized protein n=1 Tax=Paracoccus thiocyanatus TaxID=34006 RepID=A0A1N6P105_9RHOB|nr:hypothetical protein [Paracoccus thiocyanatus]SIP98034.1 hypothetical protein SAMN05421641_102194 [Paracoccus thiocyanatus]